MNDYVIVKLLNGEQLMATLLEETKETFRFTNVLAIKTVHMTDGERQYESISVAPFCQFTDDPDYTLQKSIVIFVKTLSENLVPKYLNLLDQEYKINTQPASVDEFVDRIQSIADKLKEQGIFVDNYEEDDSDLPPILVKGNDTLQ